MAAIKTFPYKLSENIYLTRSIPIGPHKTTSDIWNRGTRHLNSVYPVSLIDVTPPILVSSVSFHPINQFRINPFITEFQKTHNSEFHYFKLIKKRKLLHGIHFFYFPQFSNSKKPQKHEKRPKPQKTQKRGVSNQPLN